MPNASVMWALAFGPPKRPAYQSSGASSVRGLNRVWIPAVARASVSSGLWAEHHAWLDLRTGSPASWFQYSRKRPATAGSRTTWPTFKCPKMPPSLMLVEPVHTDTGVSPPALSVEHRTMNLLWAILALVRLRRKERSSPAASIAFSLPTPVPSATTGSGGRR